MCADGIDAGAAQLLLRALPGAPKIQPLSTPRWIEAARAGPGHVLPGWRADLDAQSPLRGMALSPGQTAGARPWLMPWCCSAGTQDARCVLIHLPAGAAPTTPPDTGFQELRSSPLVLAAPEAGPPVRLRARPAPIARGGASAACAQRRRCRPTRALPALHQPRRRNEFFPRLDPAIIALVSDGEARAARAEQAGTGRRASKRSSPARRSRRWSSSGAPASLACRPSSARSPSLTSTMIAGSRRGKNSCAQAGWCSAGSGRRGSAASAPRTRRRGARARQMDSARA